MYQSKYITNSETFFLYRFDPDNLDKRLSVKIPYTDILVYLDSWDQGMNPNYQALAILNDKVVKTFSGNEYGFYEKQFHQELQSKYPNLPEYLDLG